MYILTGGVLEPGWLVGRLILARGGVVVKEKTLGVLPYNYVKFFQYRDIS